MDNLKNWIGPITPEELAEIKAIIEEHPLCAGREGDFWRADPENPNVMQLCRKSTAVVLQLPLEDFRAFQQWKEEEKKP